MCMDGQHEQEESYMHVVLLLVYFSSFNAHDFPKEVVLDDRKLLEHLRGWKANHSASKAISHALQRKFHSHERFQVHLSKGFFSPRSCTS